MPDRRTAWFTQARFGMFIHWGVFSVVKRGEQVFYREQMPPSDYRKLADRFRPRKFDADAWLSAAKRLGVRYAVLTSKNHDGFALWDSGVSDFTAAKTGLRRDYLREYVEACRRAGVKVGLYFSLADWMQPGYFRGAKGEHASFSAFVDFVHEQVRELCTNYGRLDVLWFDGIWPYSAAEWRSRSLLKMVRSLQPHCLVNNRMGLDGDFVTPEQSIPEQQFKPDVPWESCLTTTDSSWGHHGGVKWKTDHDIIRDLCSVAQLGGNLLLNVGPKADGTLPAPFRRLASKVGDWLDINREAVFNVGESICETHTFGLMTVAASKVYLHVLHWPGCELVLAGLASKVRAARLLDGGEALAFTQTRDHVKITGLPSKPPDPRNTIIVLDVEGRPRAHAWARERIWTGALEATNDHAKRVLARMEPWSRR